MALTTWSPTARGRPQTWCFYCRVALENLPLNTWEDEDTVKAVLGGGCELDRIEQRSVLQDNTAALFAWVWSLDPDLIPCVKAHSILNRPAVGRADLPEGTPAEEGRDGPLYRVLIHLDTILDYTPIDESRRKRGYSWPNKTRRDWEFGVKDNAGGPRRRPGRDRLGPSNHQRNDDREDRLDDREGVEGSAAAAAMGPTVVAKETAAGAMVATNISDMAVTTTSGARRAHLSTVATGAPLATDPGARRRCLL
jgi:hypothetical protein